VVTHFLADRGADESFATWVARADEDLLRGEGLDRLDQRAGVAS
jgi:sulfite reductase (ferredoxin)